MGTTQCTPPAIPFRDKRDAMGLQITVSVGRCQIAPSRAHAWGRNLRRTAASVDESQRAQFRQELYLLDGFDEEAIAALCTGLQDIRLVG